MTATPELTPILADIRPALERAVQAHGLPGVVVAVARGEGPAAAAAAVGADGRGQPLGPEALMTIASVTKLATALAALRLVDAGTLAPDDPLARHMPEAAAARAGITLRQLFTHTSGLGGPGSPPAADETWAAWAQTAIEAPPVRAPGGRVVYSNHNYTLLAVAVERRAGRPFQAAVRDLVLAPLGIEAYLGTAPPRPLTALEADLPEAAVRNLTLGLPGGGLATTAAGALALARAFYGVPPGFLRPATRAAATCDQTGGAGGGFTSLQWEPCPWGLGPELRGAKRPHWTSEAASPASFGHGGAGGKLAWVDPQAGVARALLTHVPDLPTMARVLAPLGAAILAAARR